MAQSIGVVCDSETGQPLQIEMRGLPPNTDILRGVLSVRPGGMVVFEQLNVQPVIVADVDDAADFRQRSDEEIMAARTKHDAGLGSAQMATVSAADLEAVGARRTVVAAEVPAPPPIPAPTPPPPAPPEPDTKGAGTEEAAEGDEPQGLEVAGPPQPPAPAVQELVTKT